LAKFESESKGGRLRLRYARYRNDMPSSPTPLLRTVIASIATADTVGNDCRLRKAPIQVDGGGLQDDAKNGGKAVAGIHERTEPKHEKGTEKRAYTFCSPPKMTASQLRGPLGASEPAARSATACISHALDQGAMMQGEDRATVEEPEQRRVEDGRFRIRRLLQGRADQSVLAGGLHVSVRKDVGGGEIIKMDGTWERVACPSQRHSKYPWTGSPRLDGFSESGEKFWTRSHREQSSIPTSLSSHISSALHLLACLLQLTYPLLPANL